MQNIRSTALGGHTTAANSVIIEVRLSPVKILVDRGLYFSTLAIGQKIAYLLIYGINPPSDCYKRYEQPKLLGLLTLRSTIFFVY